MGDILARVVGRCLVYITSVDCVAGFSLIVIVVVLYSLHIITLGY